jgi:geranylgeranylglycerol-phosphate geranylgeranyltransferase
MGKLGALFRLTRFEHSILLIIAVIGAEILAGGLPSAQVAALSIITPIFLSMSAFAINDYFDVNVDRANKKKRPLVTRELRPSDALAVASVSMVIGIAGGLLLNAYCFIIAVIFGVLSILYSYKLKDVPLIGSEPGRVRGRPSDAVLNGMELGSGSIRIHRSTQDCL